MMDERAFKELKREIRRAVENVTTAYVHFDEAEPDFIAAAALEVSAANERLNALMKKAKEAAKK